MSMPYKEVEKVIVEPESEYWDYKNNEFFNVKRYPPAKTSGEALVKIDTWPGNQSSISFLQDVFIY